MNDNGSKEKFDTAIDTWQSSMDRRQFKVALKAGIGAYLLGEAEGNEVEFAAAMVRIHFAPSELILGQKSNNPALLARSFCGQSGEDVRLGAGPAL